MDGKRVVKFKHFSGLFCLTQPPYLSGLFMNTTMKTGTLTVKANIEPPQVGGTFTVNDFGKCEITSVAVAENGLPFYDLTFKTADDFEEDFQCAVDEWGGGKNALNTFPL